MASSLNSKINSYSLERGIEFNEAFSLTPTRTGSNPNGTYTKNTGTSPTFESTVGPVGGAGSWSMPISTTSANNAYITAASSSATELAGAGDSDYSTGFWFKLSAVPTGTSTTALRMHTFGAVSANAGFGVFVTGNTSTNPTKLQIQFSGTQNIITDTTLVANTWYYLAVTRIGDAANNIKIYLNGSLKITATNNSTTAPAVLTFGGSGSGVINSSFNISNYYSTTTSQIGATQIGEIWTAGSSSAVSASISATPLTASTNNTSETISTEVVFTTTSAQGSALQTEPTIAIGLGDHVEITTSIIVNATFPSGISFGGTVNVEIYPDAVLTASIEMINNVDISTGSDVSFSVVEFIAEAMLVQPQIPSSPMTASAVSGDHSAHVTPSYYSLVKSADPLFYTNLEDSTITNFGTWSGVTYTVGSSVTKNNVSTGDMGMIAGGESWKFTGVTQNSPNYVDIIPQNATTTIGNLVMSDFTAEYWFKADKTGRGVGLDIGPFTVVYTPSAFGVGSVGFVSSSANSMMVIVDNLVPLPGNPASSTLYFPGSQDIVIFNDWNHIVLKSQGSSLSLYVNGSIAASGSYSQNNWSAQSANWTKATIYASRFEQSGEVTGFSGQLFDEVAIYDSMLTNSQIIDHHSFIRNQDPNRLISILPITAFAESGSHNFTVTSVVDYVQSSITASSNIVTPTVTASKNVSLFGPALTANATITESTVYWGWTVVTDAAIAYAESTNAFRLNDIYYNYVQTNIAPYRYVTFDGNNAGFDYGTDTDYSVISTVIGGSVVNPDLGINGKSAKTGGTSYLTDGVILKESEWNDDWGTSTNAYHSSFWMQRALDDNSTTGLRVIQSTISPAYGTFGVLYQYQNKLTFELFNGTSYYTQTTVGNHDLFDYNRHFVAVDFRHIGANNFIDLYIDAVVVMTIDLGTTKGILQNSTTFLPPNDEANNFDRFAIGCLITPFEQTALPVQPTNTKIYVDEIIWAKSALGQTLATNLFNIMPDKDNSIFIATPITASAQMTSSSITTTVNYVAQAMTSGSAIIQPTLYVQRESINNVTIITANAEMMNALMFQEANIVSDIFVATVIFNNAGVKITIPGGPMLASVTLPPEITGVVNVYLNSEGDIGTSFPIYFNTQKSAYVNYVIKESSISSITRVREVK